MGHPRWPTPFLDCHRHINFKACFQQLSVYWAIGIIVIRKRKAKQLQREIEHTFIVFFIAILIFLVIGILIVARWLPSVR